MQWSTATLYDEEYQTLEYVLEYGGEGGRSAILRTTLRGCPRYWQLEHGYDWEDDEPIANGRSTLNYLALTAGEALERAAHPWWKLEGLFVATDLVPLVIAKLETVGRTLESWLNPQMNFDPHALLCEVMWPNCDVPKQPVDAYWLTGRPETLRRLQGGLTTIQVEGLKRCPAKGVGVLVDRKGRILMTEEADYPMANQWNGYSPFLSVIPFSVHALPDVWAASQKGMLIP